MTKAFSVITADPAWQCADQLPGKGRGASKHYQTMATDEICKIAVGRSLRHNRQFLHRPPLHGCGDAGLEMSGRIAWLADDAILGLWRLASMQPDALEVARAWGFTVKSELVWVKHRPCVDCKGAGRGVHRFGGKVTPWTCELCDGTGCGTRAFGMGRYTRHAHEVCLLATRGKMASKILDHSIPSVLNAPMPWNWETNRAIHSAKPEIFYTGVMEKLAAGPYLELFGRRRRRGWTVLGNQVGKLARVA